VALDADLVERIDNKLNAEGVKVWRDKRAIFFIFVGELQHRSTIGDIYGDFLAGSGMPTSGGEVTVIC